MLRDENGWIFYVRNILLLKLPSCRHNILSERRRKIEVNNLIKVGGKV